MKSNAKLTVNLDNIHYNLLRLKEKQNPGTMVLAMVKANSYGLGVIPISKYLETKELAQCLGVAYINEAEEIRQSGIKLPIMILGPCMEEDISKLLTLDNVMPTVVDLNYAEKFNNECLKSWKIKKINIEIETGMHRAGIYYKNAVDIIEKISMMDNIQIYSIHTHLSSADSDIEYTNMQLERFNSVIDELKIRGIKVPVAHVLNSAGSTIIKDDRYNMIRPGIMMYGYYPDPQFKTYIDLKPSCKLECKVYSIENVFVGEGVGYNQSIIVEESMKVASITIGYADGYRREISNKGYVSINGHKCKVIGKVCMDVCMVDVTGIDDIKIGDIAIIFDEENISLDDIADICNTISYEILTDLGNRVERFYIG